MRFFRAPRPSQEAPQRSRLRRWAPRVLGFAAGLLGLAVLALLVALHSLDRPWIRGKVRALARASAGLEIDYQVVRVGLLSGIEIEGLVVQSPAEVHLFAPELARIGRIDARWHPGSLFGRGPLLDRVTITDVSLAVVIDEHGRTSFDAIPTSGPRAPPAPPVPLSRQAESVLGTAFPVSEVVIDNVALTLVRTKGGEVAEHTELRGISATLHATSAAPSEKGSRATVALGTAATPLALQLTRARVGSAQASARAQLWLTVDATSSAVDAALDLKMLDQTFAPSVSADHWFHTDAKVRFDPAAKRTEITVDHTEAGDGAAHAEAAVEIPDTGDPVVRHAQADADIARILRWVPAGVAPLTAERALVRVRVDALVGAAVPRLSDGGSALLEVDVANVGVDLPGGPLLVTGGKISVNARPTAGSVAGGGSVALVGLKVASGNNSVAAEDVGLDFDAKQAADGAITGHAGLRFARLDVAGASATLARDGHVEVHVENVVPDKDDPLKTRGDVALAVTVGSLDARSSDTHVIADAPSLRAHTLLTGRAPYAVELDAAVSRLRVLARGGALLADAPAHLKAALHDLVPDLGHPDASRGVGSVAASIGETKISLDATKGDDAVDFALHADAPSLKVVRPFLSPELAKEASWDAMAVSVHSTGHADHVHGGAPHLEQTTSIEVQRPSFETVSARSVSLTLRSKGGLLQHEADADLRVQGLAFSGGTPADDRVTLSAALDREHPSLRFQLATEGRAATKISASASFDPARRAVPYEIDAHLAGLAPLGPFLAKMHGLEGFELSQLDLALHAKGTLLGVVAGVGRDGGLQFEAHPSRTAGVEGSANLRVGQLHWSRGDNAVAAPSIAWRGEMHADGPHRTIDSHLEVDAVHLDLGPKDVDLKKIRDDSSLTVRGDLLDPEISISLHASLATVQQDFVPEYPIGDLSLSLLAERDREGLVHVTDMKLANGAGGSTVALTGNVELGVARRRLSVTTSLSQDLARLAMIPARFSGRGQLGLDATVTSPDLTLFRVRATLKGENVSLKMPHAGVEVETANGQVPITVALEVGKDGVALRADEKRSHYSMLRFADQHPLLSRSGFLSITSLKTPFVTIAPLVGNLEIEQNFVSLRQFEMGVRNGSITGQCGLDWDGPKSTLELHVRASGVQSSHGEPFDGNIAVVIAAGDRTVEGRAEILRIGERHLLDLLDMQDPLHVDPAMNRIRTALLVGYPDRLRLVFDHGFASARLELGGVARLISIGELRGIPMGPIVDRFLAPILDPSNAKDAP